MLGSTRSQLPERGGEAVRVLVCGGRDFQYKGLVRRVLIQSGATEVIHGGCRTGADKLADEVAREMGVPVTVYAAMWQVYGRRAGPMRNQLMLDQGKPDLVIAFPGGTGTADMVRRARKTGVRVIEVKE